MTGDGGEGGGRPLRGRGEWWKPGGWDEERRGRGKEVEEEDRKEGDTQAL